VTTGPLTDTPPTSSSVGDRPRPRFGRLRLMGGRHEVVLAAAIVVLSITIGAVNPKFWTVANAFALARSSFVLLIFALGVLLVMISGGIDVSFGAIGIMSGYTTVVLLRALGLDDAGVILACIIAGGIGTMLGSINAVAIAGFRVPTLIATLGTQSIFRGFMLSFVGSSVISTLPRRLDGFATSTLFSYTTAEGTLARLHWLIVPVALLCIAVSLLLQRTMFGRTVFALGGDEESARRLGLRVRSTKATIYLIAGGLAGVAGMVSVMLSRRGDPYAIVGMELDVIAAVVLGGASIMGGSGTVLGTVLGVIVINLIKNNLILLGVPGTWQRFAVGLLLVLGVTAQAVGDRARAKRANANAGAIG
jgi:simple sugar transport system permease protein